MKRHTNEIIERAAFYYSHGMNFDTKIIGFSEKSFFSFFSESLQWIISERYIHEDETEIF